MLPPPPPLNDHGRVAVNTADVAGALEDGLNCGCVVCDHSTRYHWRMPSGEYIPIHAGCVPRLVAHWHERVEAGDVDQPEVVSGARRGAYARRATSTGARVHPPRARSLPSSSMGSPWFRPGMPQGAPWIIVIESTHGRLTFCHGDNEPHAREVLRFYRATTANGTPLLFPGGPVAVGAALLDPAGDVVDGWGEEFDLDSPSRWSPPPRRPEFIAPTGGKRKRATKERAIN